MSFKLEPPELPSEGFNVPEIRLPSENKIWATIRDLSASNNKIRVVLAALFVAILGIVLFLSYEKYAVTPSKEEVVSPAAKPVADEPKKKPSKPKKPKSAKSAHKSAESVQNDSAKNNASPEVDAADATRSSGDAVKPEGKKECTQGEIALHQCR